MHFITINVPHIWFALGFVVIFSHHGVSNISKTGSEPFSKAENQKFLQMKETISSLHQMRHRNNNANVFRRKIFNPSYQQLKTEQDLTRFTGLYTGPYFVQAGNPENVTVEVGQTAILPCQVKQIGDQSVSWIRKSDSHILTVDDVTFISNDRFFILRDVNQPEKWTLHIKYALPKDTGLYECQISTEPKMNRLVYLKVEETKVYIAGNGDVHANEGSKVVFRCRISGTEAKPDFVFWYHNSQRLMPDSEPAMNFSLRAVTSFVDDTNLEVKNSSVPSSSQQQQQQRQHDSKLFEAVLTLDQVKKDQSGNYSCSPSNTKSVHVRLHVIDGEIRAAMSDGGISSCSSSQNISSLFSLLCANLYWNYYFLKTLKR